MDDVTFLEEYIRDMYGNQYVVYLADISILLDYENDIISCFKNDEEEWFTTFTNVVNHIQSNLVMDMALRLLLFDLLGM